MKLDPRHANPRAGYLLGLVLGEKHDYAGAVAELNEFIKLAPNTPDLAQVKDQLAEFEKLAGVQVGLALKRAAFVVYWALAAGAQDADPADMLARGAQPDSHRGPAKPTKLLATKPTPPRSRSAPGFAIPARTRLSRHRR